MAPCRLEGAVQGLAALTGVVLLLMGYNSMVLCQPANPAQQHR